jgi:hypothetical protein
MYDVKAIIEKLGDKYSNAIPVFGGALWAYDHVSGSDVNMAKFVSYLPSVISDAKFFKWHEGEVGALRRFCRICLVDPALVEAYLGIGFEELVKL